MFVSVIIVLSRVNMRKERKIFFNTHAHEEIIKMLHDIIKIFRDGIIILGENGTFLYHNQQCLKIFEIGEPHEQALLMQSRQRDAFK